MVNTRIGFGHDIYAYYKLYKLYLYIKISYIGIRYLLGLRADRAFAGHERKRIFIIMYIYIVTILFNILLWLHNDSMQHTHIIIIDPRRSHNIPI